MGEIAASVELENAADRGIVSQGLRDESTVRRTTVECVVDTGALMLMLPENVVARLGLERQREVIVAYADERKETRPVAGPVTARIGDRFMNTDCIVGPPLSEPLIGQIVLEALDLVADRANRTLAPRPEGQEVRRLGGEGEQPGHGRPIRAVFVRRDHAGVAQQVQPRDTRTMARPLKFAAKQEAPAAARRGAQVPIAPPVR